MKTKSTWLMRAALLGIAVAGSVGLVAVKPATAASYQAFYSTLNDNVYCSGECGTGSCCVI